MRRERRAGPEATTAKVGRKHQVVIPKDVRRRCPSLRAGSRVRMNAVDEHTIVLHVESDQWAAASRGRLADLWGGVPVEKRLKELRREWD